MKKATKCESNSPIEGSVLPPIIDLLLENSSSRFMDKFISMKLNVLFLFLYLSALNERKIAVYDL